MGNFREYTGRLYLPQKLPQNLSQIRFFSNFSPDRGPGTENLGEELGHSALPLGRGDLRKLAQFGGSFERNFESALAVPSPPLRSGNPGYLGGNFGEIERVVSRWLRIGEGIGAVPIRASVCEIREDCEKFQRIQQSIDVFASKSSPKPFQKPLLHEHFLRQSACHRKLRGNWGTRPCLWEEWDIRKLGKPRRGFWENF